MPRRVRRPSPLATLCGGTKGKEARRGGTEEKATHLDGTKEKTTRCGGTKEKATRCGGRAGPGPAGPKQPRDSTGLHRLNAMMRRNIAQYANAPPYGTQRGPSLKHPVLLPCGGKGAKWDWRHSSGAGKRTEFFSLSRKGGDFQGAVLRYCPAGNRAPDKDSGKKSGFARDAKKIRGRAQAHRRRPRASASPQAAHRRITPGRA